jgi:hypothetical protein
MSKRTENIILFAAGLVIIVLLGFYIQATSAFSLAFREQQQLFLFNAGYVGELLQDAGGCNVLAARFLVQFFCFNGLGAVVTSVLLALSAWLMWLIMRKTDCCWFAFPLCFLPSLFLSVSLLDNSFHYQGLTAGVFAILFLYVYASIFNNSRWKKFVAGLFLTLLLYYIAGAAALIFAVAAAVFDLINGKAKTSFSWIFIIIVLISGFITVQTGGEGSYAYVFTPAGYCDYTVTFRHVHWLSWAMIVISLLLTWVTNKLRNAGNIYIKGGICLLLTAVIAAFFITACNKNVNKTYERFYQLEYYAGRGEWNKILQHGSDVRNFIEANYVNLALAETGQLADQLFNYPQSGPLSLICYTKKKEYIQLVACARVLFSMGNIAAAQSLASNNDQANNGHNPSMLKILVESELIRGNYIIAKKYIDVLSASLFYAGWADGQRKYLFNDKLVMRDKKLANGRRDLPKKESFVLFKTPLDDLFNVLDANPSDQKAMQYAVSYLLLAKDVNNIQAFIDRYYGKPALTTLPVYAQEALLFCSDYYGTMKEEFAVEHGMSKEEFAKYRKIDAAYCRSHGVTDDTFNRFSQFKQDSEQSGNDSSMLARYSNTFWYYLLFTQI